MVQYKVLKGFHARNGKFIRPKGFGAIDKALRTAEKEFYKTVQEEVEKLLWLIY